MSKKRENDVFSISGKKIKMSVWHKVLNSWQLRDGKYAFFELSKTCPMAFRWKNLGVNSNNFWKHIHEETDTEVQKLYSNMPWHWILGFHVCDADPEFTKYSEKLNLAVWLKKCGFTGAVGENNSHWGFIN
jgi:hypothetical protein